MIPIFTHASFTGTKTLPKHDLSEHENSMSDSLSGSDFCKIMDQNQRLEKPGIENDQCRTGEKPTTGYDKCHTWDKSTEYDSVEDMSDESLLPDLDDSNLVEDANVDDANVEDANVEDANVEECQGRHNIPSLIMSQF